MKHFYLLILAIFLIANYPSISGTYSGGTGGQNDPFLISSPEDLIELSKTSTDWDKYFKQTKNISFKFPANRNDWNRNGTTGDQEDFLGFSPIGNADTVFTGRYDGDYYEIKNLFINRPTETNVGLFGKIGERRIWWTRIIDAQVTGNLNVGIVVGYAENAEIFNNKVINGNLVGRESVGLIAGHITDSSYVWMCTSSGKDTAKSMYIGGIVGRSNFYSRISQCNSEANVSVYGYDAGGIVGRMENHSKIDSCYSTGNIYGNDGTSAGLGGIVGALYNSSIDYCFKEEGYISGNKTCGGIIGNADNFYSRFNGYSVSNCYSKVNVTSRTGGSTNGDAGGIAGRSNTIVYINCYNEGKITNGSHFTGGIVGSASNDKYEGVYNTGNLSGLDYVGGITGEFQSLLGADTSKHVGLYSTGKVVGYRYVGGLFGKNTRAILENCYATGEVRGLTSTVGGLVGWNDNYANIRNCYIEDLFFPSTVSPDEIGGIVGRNSNHSKISDCNIWFIDTIRGGERVGGFVGLNDNYSSIVNCHVAGRSGHSSDIYLRGYSVGGVVGINQGNSTIRNCSSSGYLNYTAYAGGIVGANLDNSNVLDCVTRYLSSEARYFVQDLDITNRMMGGITGHNGSQSLIERCHVGESNFYRGEPINVSGGGVVGLNDNAYIFECSTWDVDIKTTYGGGFVAKNINNAFIQDCYTKFGNVSPGWYGGGFAYINSANSYIGYSYSQNSVFAPLDSTGGFVYDNKGTIEKCFWDMDEAGGVGDSTYGTGLSRGVMDLRATYVNAGWDFDNIWYMYSDSSVGIGGPEFKTKFFTHSITLFEGWNIISSYIDVYTDISNIFADIKDNVALVKDVEGKLYIPDLGGGIPLNIIGNWTFEKGYLVYMTADKTLNINGLKIEPENNTLAFDKGWAIIPYLRDAHLNAEDALASITGDGELILVKDYLGNIYMPDAGGGISINTIGNLKPGQGYQAYFAKDGSRLTYPANPLNKETNKEVTPSPKYLLPIYYTTGNSSNIIIDIDAPDGNEIGIYNSNGELIGSGAIHKNKATVTIWGDNIMTDEIDGAVQNELLSAKYLNTKTGNFHNLEITDLRDFISGEFSTLLEYFENKVYLAKGIVTIEDDILSLNISPNPVRESVEINLQTMDCNKTKLMLYNLNGKLIYDLTDKISNSNYQTLNIDLSSLSIGEYNLVLICGKEQILKKLAIIK